MLRYPLFAVRRSAVDLVHQHQRADQAGIASNLGLDLIGDVGIFGEKYLRLLPSLPKPFAVVGEPGTSLFDDARCDAQIDNFARLRRSFAIHDVDRNLLESSRHLVLADFHSRPVANPPFPSLDRAVALDVATAARIQIQAIPTYRRPWV